jgi:hypothetical protein
MKKKFMITVFAAVLLGCLLSSCGGKETPAERIERICDIELPKEMEAVYEHIEPHGFTGMPSQFTIFKVKERPEEFLNNDTFSFLAGRDHGFEKGFDGRISAYDVPEKYYPNWETQYLYHMPNPTMLLMVYFEETLTLMVYVMGH